MDGDVSPKPLKERKRSSKFNLFPFTAYKGVSQDHLAPYTPQGSGQDMGRGIDDISLESSPTSFRNEIDDTAYDLPPRPNQKQSHSSFRSWFPELLATFLAVASLLAIVIVLRVYDGKSTDTIDLPAGLTLNGLIAAIATLERVFLIVPVASAISQEAWVWLASQKGVKLRDVSLSDSASRGAWGSMVMIFYAGTRWITLLGALISVLSLAIGTFTQQLITTQNIPVTDANSALSVGTIPRAEYYANFHGNPAEGALSPLLDMKAAIYQGFMADTVPETQIDCPTGNCTFPLTPSLAICGGCNKIDFQLSNCNSTMCNYTTTTGTSFQMQNWSTADMGVGFQVQQSAASLGPQDNNTANNNYTIFDFESMGLPYQYLSGGLYGTEPTYTAHRCKLWMCVNVYNASVNSGNMDRSIVESYTDVTEDKELEIGSSSNYTFTLPNKYTNVDGQKVTYKAYWLALVALGSQLSDIVTGGVFLNLSGYRADSDIVEAVWSGMEQPQQWISNVVKAMTNVVRSDQPIARPAYNGTAYQAGIKVRWLWLILPIALVVLSVLLLIVVMIRTARSDIGVWKGSPLPLLLFDIDHGLRQRLNGSNSLRLDSSMDKHIENQRVALQRIGNGKWLLKDAKIA